MNKQRIKVNDLKPEEIYSVCSLLVKAGYTVRRIKEKHTATSRVYDHYIEYWEGI